MELSVVCWEINIVLASLLLSAPWNYSIRAAKWSVTQKYNQEPHSSGNGYTRMKVEANNAATICTHTVSYK